MRQEKIHKNFQNRIHGFTFCKRSNELQRANLVKHEIGIMNRGNKEVNVIRIFFHVQQTGFNDGPVGNDSQSPHKNKQGNRFFYIRNKNHNLMVGKFGCWGNTFHRGCANGFGGIFRYGTDFCRMSVFIIRLVFANIKHVVGKFFLAHNDLFFAINNEITAKIISTFPHLKANFWRQFSQDA